MYKIVMLLIVGGAALSWHGYKEYRLNQCVAVKPRTMTCAELDRNGPGENAHIRLTDFLLCANGFVSEKQDRNSPWTTIWIPAVSMNGAYANELKNMVHLGVAMSDLPRPRKTRVIVKSTNVQTTDQLQALGDRPFIEGLIINKVESLGVREKQLLAKTYPAIDFSQCWILEEGREPISSGASFAFMAGGAVACLGGFVLVAKHH